MNNNFCKLIHLKLLRNLSNEWGTPKSFRFIFAVISGVSLLFSTVLLAQESPRVSPYDDSGERNGVTVFLPKIVFSPTTYSSTDYALYPSSFHQSEMTIAISPVDPNKLLVGANTIIFDFLHKDETDLYQGYYYSSNGGTIWAGSDILPGTSNRAIDPAVAFNTEGNAYFHYLDNYVPYVKKSTNGGVSWQTSVEIPGIEKADKGHIETDGNNIYVGLTDVRSDYDEPSPVVISRSTDGGASFLNAVNISGSETSHFSQGVNLVIGTQGEVYAVWAIADEWYEGEYGSDGIGFNKSLDGGATWDPPSRIFNISGSRDWWYDKNPNGTLAPIRMNDFPCIAVDRSGGVWNGTIYMVWGEKGPETENQTTDRANIHFSKSMNNGATWSNPVIVNDDNTTNDQWFPWITVNPHGVIYIVFYDSRDDPNNQLTEVWVAQSADGGQTFTNYRVSDVAFTPYPIQLPIVMRGYMGDYIGITSKAGVAYASWMDNRTGIYQAYVDIIDNTVSGTITSNTTWSGYKLVTGNVTVNSGVKLTISAGTSVFFESGTRLTINGTLKAQGLSNNRIIFDRSGSNGWYGIVINSSSGSSSNITSADIKNANYGLLINSASPTITNTKINYNGTGVQILSGGAPKFSNNTITYNDYNGVSGFGGVTPSFGTFPTYGDNVIRRNGDRGIYAAYSSTVFLGQYTLPPSGGRNSIYENYNTNGYQISILYGSTSMAEMNWWGSDPPDPNIFNSSSGNDIDYDPWWTGSDPHAGRSLTKGLDNGYNPDISPVISRLDSLREKLWRAFNFYQKAEYDSALQIGKAILKTSPSSQEALSVLNVLRLAYNEGGKPGFQNYIKSLIAQHSGKELAGVARLNLAYYLAKQGDFIAALSRLQENVYAFPNSPLERISLFQKAVFFLLELEDRESTEAVLAELERKYPDDPLVVETKRLLGQSIQQYRPQKQAETSDTIDFALLANYPNPFNPTTTIEYSIPEASFVELNIYDILGGEVATLVKENKLSGKHSVEFNASNLPSGVYFYRIVSGNFTATKKLIILK